MESWKKIEDGDEGPWSWTDYHDHDGNVYRIYNLMINPATPNAFMTKDDGKE